MAAQREDPEGRKPSIGRAAFLAALLLASGSAARAQEIPPAEPAVKPVEAVAASDPTRAPAPPPPIYEPRYHSLAECEALVDAWIAAAESEAAAQVAQLAQVERIELPATTGKRPVPALQWGARGPIRLADRPTVFLVGGLDGVSLAGCEAVLATAAAMLADPAALPADVTFVAIPWASPDGLAATLAGISKEGRSALPLDDDGDQRVDEDGPDDVDGDGRVLEMLIEDPEGPWTRAADPRFLAAARAGDTPRYRRTSEGRDDDGDGQFNEDPVGGVDLDRSFPLGWRSSGRFVLGGPLPLEEAPARALADLLLERRSACVLLFQGHHGAIAMPAARVGDVAHPREAAPPGEAARPDEAQQSGEMRSRTSGVLACETLTRLFAQATGRPQHKLISLAAARGEGSQALQSSPRSRSSPGSALDWIDAVTGAFAAEVAVWGPAVEEPPDGKPVGLTDARFATAPGSDPTQPGAPRVSDVDRAWGRWLDNTRGGIGFVEWHPVELGDGRQALIGGWEDFSRLNPPAKTLAVALQGIPAFAATVARALPVLEVQLSVVRRDGEICRIRGRVENQGSLPAGLGCPGDDTERAGVRLRLIVPAGARILAGESQTALGELCGGCASRELEWIVLAPAGAALGIEASSPLAATVVREVRP